MRIAIDVSQVIYGTGVSVYTRQLVTKLAKLVVGRHELVLFGGSLRRKGELDLWINRLPNTTNRTHHLPPTFLHFLWNNFHLLNAETFTGPVDLIHTSDWAEPPAKAPKVTTVHDLNFFRDPQYALPEVRRVHVKRLYWVAKESAKIIAVSLATKNDLIKYLDIDPQRIEVIYEGPSFETAPLVSFAATEHLKAKYQLTKPFIFVPGAGHPRKNLKRIIRAFHDAKLDYQLLIAGRASASERNRAGQDVIFSGFLSEHDWGPLLSLSEALLYPSLYEGFGVPILDAFVCGVPVITSNTSSLPEVAGSAAILVDPLEPEAITRGIIKALNQKDALIKAGAERLARFSWTKTAQETLQLYESVISKESSLIRNWDLGIN